MDRGRDCLTIEVLTLAIDKDLCVLNFTWIRFDPVGFATSLDVAPYLSGNISGRI